MESKLWLCRELEKLFISKKESQTIWILGGWVGLLPFLLLSRENLKIKTIRLFDKDPLSEKIADSLNENWLCRAWKFKAKTIDCNQLDYKDLAFADSEKPDIIINTSVEHFSSRLWYDNIPTGKTIALQACDLLHKEHIAPVHSKEELKDKFPHSQLLFSGELNFDYKTHSFSRYMAFMIK